MVKESYKILTAWLHLILVICLPADQIFKQSWLEINDIKDEEWKMALKDTQSVCIFPGFLNP